MGGWEREGILGGVLDDYAALLQEMVKKAEIGAANSRPAALRNRPVAISAAPARRPVLLPHRIGKLYFAHANIGCGRQLKQPAIFCRSAPIFL
jgi:hypothetical protein